MGHGNGYGFGAGLCLLRRQSYSARFEHTDRWEIGRLTASGMQDVRQGIRELQRASQPGLSEGRSVGTHGNGAAAERRSEVQPLVLTGREPEQQGGVTDVSCSCSHSMPLACCCLFSISQKLNASPRRMATMLARHCNLGFFPRAPNATTWFTHSLVMFPCLPVDMLNGEANPSLRFRENMLSKVNQPHVAPRVAYRLRPTPACYSHITQLLQRVGLGIYKLFKSPVVNGKIRMVKTQKRRMFSVFGFSSVGTWMFRNRCCLGIPHPLCPEWQSCGMCGAFVTPKRDRS